MVLLGTSANAATENCHVESGSSRTAVVELFTSEGCSSCPPADAWLLKQAQSAPAAKVIFLSQHVPYWDYLGWKDPFAKPELELRQRQLARANSTSVYTPQFFVNGREARLDNLSAKAMQNQLSAVNATAASIKLAINRLTDGRIQFSWKHEESSARGRLMMAITSAELSSKVTAGENNARRLVHGEVTRWWQSAANIQSAMGQITTNLPKIDDDGQGQIVLMMLDSQGEVMQAVSLSRTCHLVPH